MSTKLKGDVAEHAVILHSLKAGWDVLLPVGDRLPYDLVIVEYRRMIRIQVKSAWKDRKCDDYVVDTRRSHTNRRKNYHTKYHFEDFDFAVVWVQDLDVFYVFPSKVICQNDSSKSAK